MLEKISNLLNAVTEFLGGFSKLNDVKDHSVNVFLRIILCTMVALFLGKLFLRNDLYDWVLSVVMQPNSITISFVIWMAMVVYSLYARKRTVDAVLAAMKQQKREERRKDKECYAMTTKIEDEANELTDYLRDALHCDVVTIELMHNTEKYIGGYHKRFYDESFPSVNTVEGVYFNYKDFQCIPTNLFPMINYILKNKFRWFSSMDEVASVDAGFAQILKDYKCIALGMRAIKTPEGEDLGILTVTWREGHEDRIPDNSVIQERMTEIASKLELLLDMTDYK